MTKETNVEEKNDKSRNIRRENRGKTQNKNVRGNSKEKKEFQNYNEKSNKKIGKRRTDVGHKENSEQDFRFKKSKLKIIPLGGLEEIGKNITVFEYEDDIVLVDCGLEFPEENMLGVDMVIPDVTYLEKNADRVRGLVVTHGHEDHIGSIPYVLKKVSMPIYSTKLTIGLIKNN